MTEFFILAFLALAGFMCTGLLGTMLWRSARYREIHLGEHALTGEIQPLDELEPPDIPYLLLELYPPSEILPIMAEFFPAEYRRFRRGASDYAERRWVWEACGAIRDAREEIEELCS